MKRFLLAIPASFMIYGLYMYWDTKTFYTVTALIVTAFIVVVVCGEG